MSEKAKISILQRGGIKNHEVLERAARWALSRLLSTRMANTLTLRIEVRSTKLDEGTDGVVRTASNGSKATKFYKIILHRDHTLSHQLRILFHEIAHVAQFATGRLQHRIWKSDRKLHYRWEGKEMGSAEENPYFTRPWEVEARSIEAQYAREWASGAADQ